jgi:hypothetical protein
MPLQSCPSKGQLLVLPITLCFDEMYTIEKNFFLQDGVSLHYVSSSVRDFEHAHLSGRWGDCRGSAEFSLRSLTQQRLAFTCS